MDQSHYLTNKKAKKFYFIAASHGVDAKTKLLTGDESFL